MDSVRAMTNRKCSGIALALSLFGLLVIAAIAHLSRPSGASVLTRVSTGDRLEGFPRTILWAWERPENLTFIDPASTGVAFLAQTLYLHGSKVMVRPRLQPLRVPPRTLLIAVVRIETDGSTPFDDAQSQRQKAVSAIAELGSLPGIRGVQIDFDARQSERKVYRELLRDVRNRLDPSIPLSMTALASWCMYDNWLAQLPVDEAVPMLFRMGVDERNVRSFLSRKKRFPASQCQSSVGLSLDEPLAQLPPHRRMYLFNPKPWSESALQRIRVENKQ
jgi:hypothetical protein